LLQTRHLQVPSERPDDKIPKKRPIKGKIKMMIMILVLLDT